MIFDCDVHHGGPTKQQWLDYLDEPYRSEVAEHGLRKAQSGIRTEDGGNRWDASANTPAQVREQLLDPYGTRYALLSGNYGSVASSNDPDYAAAVCKAYNDYTIEQWLEADDRFLAGIKVPLQDPQLAVAEIERVVGHERMVAALFWGASNRIPFGQRYYWPIYEAIERHGLALHIHPSTTTVVLNHATTPAGMATSYLETHICLAQFYQANLVSLVLEGVFEVFPKLRVMMVEGGFGWLAPLLWRMDKEYKGLRQQAPRLKRLPSDYVRVSASRTTPVLAVGG